jgi:cell division protein FtsN
VQVQLSDNPLLFKQILPGAPSNFLQEIAVLEERTSLDEETQKGMYVMGQASKKFVITPELGSLLRQDAIERREEARRQKEEEAAKAQSIKKEQEEKAKMPAGKPKRPPGKPAPRPRPSTGTASSSKPKPAPPKAA